MQCVVCSFHDPRRQRPALMSGSFLHAFLNRHTYFTLLLIICLLTICLNSSSSEPWDICILLEEAFVAEKLSIDKRCPGTAEWALLKRRREIVIGLVRLEARPPRFAVQFPLVFSFCHVPSWKPPLSQCHGRSNQGTKRVWKPSKRSS